MPHTATVPTRTMTYDDDNRLLTVNGVNVTNDADGNLTYGPLPSGTLGTYGYDARNRLLSAGGVSYGYEALGNRTSLTSGTNTTSVIVNPNASLSQVLMRIKSGVTNYYIYGQGLLYQVTETGGTTNLAVYHYDYRGSTVAITDGSGRVTDRIEYSLYGTTTYRAGNTDTPYLFNGQFGVQTDPNGLLYMRARYYNPYLCRFLNGDPVGFSGGLNWYAFANGNPISLSDPLGLDPAFSPGIGMFSGLTPAQEVQASRQAAPFVGGVVFGATVACGIIFAAPVAASALVWAGFTETAATATVSAGVYTAGGYGAYRTVASTAQSVRAGDWDAVAFNVGTLTGGSVVGINGGGRFMAESLMGKPSPAPNTLNPIAILQYEIVNSYKPSLGPPGLEYWATAPTPFSGGFSAATAASSAGTFIQPFGGASGQGGWINPSQGYNSSKIK
jgi:RHS repeat-associated protein